MKNIVKLSVVALTILSLAACGDTNKVKTPIDSASTTAKGGIDSNKVDTAKKDTIKK